MVSYAYLAESKPIKNSIIGSARKALGALIVVSPFLIYYKSPVLVNNLLSLLFIVEFALAFFVVLAQNKLSISRFAEDHTLLCLWLLFITLFISLFDFFGSLSQSYIISSSTIVLVPAILLFAFSGAVDIYSFLRLYQTACFIVLFLIAMQMVLYYSARIPLQVTIPFLELDPHYNLAFARLETMLASQSSYVRFSSIFLNLRISLSTHYHFCA